MTKATRFEVRHQTLLHLLLVGLALLAYLIDPDDIVWALVRRHSNSALLERIAFGVGALVMLGSASLETWATAFPRLAAPARIPLLTRETPRLYAQFPLRLARLLLASALVLLLPLSGAVMLIIGELALVLRLILRDRESAPRQPVPESQPTIPRPSSVQPRLSASSWRTGFRTAASKWGLAASIILFTFTLHDRIVEIGAAVSFLLWLTLNMSPSIRSELRRS